METANLETSPIPSCQKPNSGQCCPLCNGRMQETLMANGNARNANSPFCEDCGRRRALCLCSSRLRIDFNPANPAQPCGTSNPGVWRPILFIQPRNVGVCPDFSAGMEGSRHGALPPSMIWVAARNSPVRVLSYNEAAKRFGRLPQWIDHVGRTMHESTFVTRVVIENFKSIAACDVRLGPLTFLVGPNGAGKSNFLDALNFVRDGLVHSLDFGIRKRGGFHRLWHYPRLVGNHLAIALNLTLRTGVSAAYSFRMRVAEMGPVGWRWEVVEEECRVGSDFFHLKDGQIASSMGSRPVPSLDRLFLVLASGQSAFREVFDALSDMQFYHLLPSSIPDIDTYDAQDRSSFRRQQPGQRFEGNAARGRGRASSYRGILEGGASHLGKNQR